MTGGELDVTTGTRIGHLLEQYDGARWRVHDALLEVRTLQQSVGLGLEFARRNLEEIAIIMVERGLSRLTCNGRAFELRPDPCDGRPTCVQVSGESWDDRDRTLGTTVAWETLERDIVNWARQTFPKATVNSILAHLGDEVAEVQKAVESGNLAQAKIELADVGLLAIHLAAECRGCLSTEIRDKFNENRTRSWGNPDERGVVRHVG